MAAVRSLYLAKMYGLTLNLILPFSTRYLVSSNHYDIPTAWPIYTQ